MEGRERRAVRRRLGLWKAGGEEVIEEESEREGRAEGRDKSREVEGSEEEGRGDITWTTIISCLNQNKHFFSSIDHITVQGNNFLVAKTFGKALSAKLMLENLLK